MTTTLDENFRPWFDNYDKGVPYTIEATDEPLFSLLDEAARKYPFRNALIFKNKKITYQQLQIQAEIFAASLRLLGVDPGSRVALMLPNLPQTMIAFWGVIKAGGVAVMTNPLYMEAEIVHHFEDSEAECLITLDLLWSKIEPLRDKIGVKNYIVTSLGESLAFPLNAMYKLKTVMDKKNSPSVPYDGMRVHRWEDMFKSKQRFSLSQRNYGNMLALLQYTGGTTGSPKGVMLTHSNLLVNARQIIAVLQENQDTYHIFISILPFFHVYGLCVGMIIPAVLAATSLPLPRYVPGDVLKLIKKHKPTIFPGAPSVYISLMQQKELSKYDLKSIRICVSGSAPLSPEHYRRFQELTGAIIIEGYGLTEASPITHINPLRFQSPKPGSIGMPLPGTDARVVDMEGGSLTLPSGKLGELVVKGPQVMQGYWNRADETASALRNEWLYTGDLATMDEDGYFFLVDRKKDMVIVAGYNVYPREIDDVLAEHPKIKEAVAVGVKDPSRGESIKAYIVLHENCTMTRAEVVAFCRSKMATYKIPRQVEFRDSLPKTIVGKVLRRALRAEEDARRVSSGLLPGERLGGYVGGVSSPCDEESRVRIGSAPDVPTSEDEVAPNGNGD